MKPGKSDTGLDSGAQTLRFRVRNVPHRKDRNDQVEAYQVWIGESTRLIFLGDHESVFG
jgi:hypothetical protein